MSANADRTASNIVFDKLSVSLLSLAQFVYDSRVNLNVYLV
jgi:hypothetical protein